MIQNVILDWSGTLVDDLAAVMEGTNHVLRQAGREPMTLDEFRSRFFLPVSEFYARELPDLEATQVEAWFHERFAEVQSQVVALPHAAEFLAFCRRQGLRVFIFTTVPEPYYRLQASRLGWLGLIEEAWTCVADKRQAIGKLLSRHGLDRLHTLLVGDMRHDMDAARAGGVAACAVLTGYQPLQELRRGSPDLVVEHLGELQRVLERHGLDLRQDSAAGGARQPVPTVGALVRNGRGECLMVRTRKWSGLWGIPGGKIKYGERAEDALRREILEETGLKLDGIHFVLVQDCVESSEFYRPEHFLLLNYVCRCDRDEAVTLNHEAEAFCWVKPEDALRMALNQPTRVLLEAVMRQEREA